MRMGRGIKRVSDQQMEILEGGGCLSVFGWPFLGAGLFMIFLATGLGLRVGDSDLNLWARLGMVFGGIVFTTVGGLFAFGRSIIVIDRARGVVWRNRSLLSVLIQSHSFPIHTFQSVELGFQPGDSETPDIYSVVLKNTDGTCKVSISSQPNYADAWEDARQLAKFLDLPLADTTTDHSTILSPGDVDKPLAQRLRESREEVWPVRPVAMVSQVKTASDRLHIQIPHRGFRVFIVFGVVVLILLLYFLADFVDLLRRWDLSEPLPWMIAGFLLLMFGLLPLSSVLFGALRGQKSQTEILVTKRGLQMIETWLWWRRVLSIEATDIVGLDYALRKDEGDQSHGAFGERIWTKSSRDSVGSGKPSPRWIDALARLSQSKGITIKHRRGVFTFGSNLPDEEIKYLYSLIRRALT